MGDKDFNWIYVASNPSFPGFIKVGWTRNNPYTRLKELDTTGVPEPFALEYVACLSNAGELEKRVHECLDFCRVRKNREFFNIDVGDAVLKIKSVATDMGFDLYFERCEYVEKDWLVGLDDRDIYSNESDWLADVYVETMEKAIKDGSLKNVCKLLVWTLGRESVFPYYWIPDGWLEGVGEGAVSDYLSDDYIERFYSACLSRLYAEDVCQCELVFEIHDWLYKFFRSELAGEFVDLLLNSPRSSVRLAAAVILFEFYDKAGAKDVFRVELLNPLANYDLHEFRVVVRAAYRFLQLLIEEGEHCFDMALLKFASDMERRSHFRFSELKLRVLKYMREHNDPRLKPDDDVGF